MKWRSNDLVLRVLAPLAALFYPGIIWCGPRISPLFLAAAMLVPLLGWFAADRLAARAAFPMARLAAHVAVAAPPLYSLLGGWMDFRPAVPFSSAGVWLPIWLGLLVAVLIEKPRLTPTALREPPWLATTHGISAAVIALFAAPHLINHLAGLLGGDAHRAIMSSLRVVYRDPRLEPILLFAVTFQAATGIWLLRRALARVSSRLQTLQTASGAYLLLFLASHVSATLRTRARGGDTNWDWLAGGELLTDPWSARLAPYYFLAVIAFGMHIAVGLGRVLASHGLPPARVRTLVAVIATLATGLSTAIMVGLLRA
jgi:succinate dehydrogenase/fumarate reductase cytochrome b subunit